MCSTRNRTELNRISRAPVWMDINLKTKRYSHNTSAIILKWLYTAFKNHWNDSNHTQQTLITDSLHHIHTCIPCKTYLRLKCVYISFRYYLIDQSFLRISLRTNCWWFQRVLRKCSSRIDFAVDVWSVRNGPFPKSWNQLQ